MAMLLLIQFVALFLTFSYSSLVFLGIGVMVMGILIKHKRLITWTMVYLVILTMVLPSIHSSIEIISRENLSQWFGELETIKNNWIFGGSITSKEGGFISSQANQGNSYLLLWSTYGLLGLAIFFRVLWCYFADIYKKYVSEIN